MKHVILSMTALFCMNFAGSMFGQSRTEYELDSLAFSVLGDNTGGARTVKSLNRLKSSDVLQDNTLVGAEIFYLYNSEEQFVIVSSDKRMPAILGYSDRSILNPSTMNKGIRAFFEKIKIESSYLEKCTLVSTRSDNHTEYSVVAPLLGERCWGQDEPFNNDMPYNNHTGYNYYTGCVTTALAQIMALHQYPEYYEWNNMPNVYKRGEYTFEQGKIVARLMKEIGDAVGNIYNNDGSTSSNSSRATEALVKKFGYDDDCRFLEKTCYTDEEWKEILNNELQQGRPVFYSGQGSGGHAFVVDGVDENGLYHINWGWNGSCNGYFYLNSLVPDERNDYSFENEAIINIRPEDGLESELHTNVVGEKFISDKGHGIFQSTTEISTTINNLSNFHPNGFSGGSIKLMLTSDKDSFISVLEGKTKKDKAKPIHYITGKLPKDLSDGNYRIYVGVQQGGYNNWEIARMHETEGISARSYIELILKNGYYSLGTGKSPQEEHNIKLVCEDLETLNFKMKGTLPRHNDIHLTPNKKQSIYNFGETSFSGTLQLVLFNEKNGLITPFGKEANRNLIASEDIYNTKESTVEVGGSIPDSVTNGKYRLYIGAKSDNSDKWMFVENINEKEPSYIDLVVKDSHIRLGNHYEEPDFSFCSVLTDSIQSISQGEEYKNALKITNTSTQETEFSYYVCLDEQKLYHSKKIVIPAGTTVTDSVRFTIPQNINNGDYNITYYYEKDQSPLFGKGKIVGHSIELPYSITAPRLETSHPWATIKTDGGFLHFSTHIDLESWDIISTVGSTILQGTPENTTINTYTMLHGIYLLRGFGKDGKVYVMKITRK